MTTATTAEYLRSLYGLEGQVVIITGATGVLGGALAEGFARAGASVGVLGRRAERTADVVERLRAFGGDALALPADVTDRAQLSAARDAVLERWGQIDVLVNAAGGPIPSGTVAEDQTIFDIPPSAFDDAFQLNFIGSLLPSQVFGEVMVRAGTGSILNISSMSVARAITRATAYGAAKAAIENFTRWLAVELARKHGPGLRVNAITPGFFIGEANRRLLVEEDGSPTPRGRLVLAHTPATRFGEPHELVGAALWLSSPSAAFVNGIAVPVDGGFSSFTGV